MAQTGVFTLTYAAWRMSCVRGDGGIRQAGQMQWAAFGHAAEVTGRR
jgi:hypothetical protein